MACPIPRVPPVTRAVCPASENIDGNAEDVMLFERLQLVAVRKSKKGCRWSKAEEISDVVVLLWDAHVLVASRPTSTFSLIP